MIEKPIQFITKEEIELLIKNEVSESRSIEYKKELKVYSDSDKKEFLADVSSFANASGGDLIFGIEESEGKPIRAHGISINADSEILKLESIIRTSIEPRIQGIQFKHIEGFDKGTVLIIRIPKSWSSPHMIIFKNNSRFFTRNSNGKHQMDVTEIRTGFLLSETITTNIQNFVDNRINTILSDEGPAKIYNNPIAIIHFIPLSAFSTNKTFTTMEIDEKSQDVLPIASSTNIRYNFDGVLKYSWNEQEPCNNISYCQLFRNGITEYVWQDFVIDKIILSPNFENNIIDSIKCTIKYVDLLELGSPNFLFICLHNVKNIKMTPANRIAARFVQDTIDRNHLKLPNIMIEGNNIDVKKSLKPIFDLIWNACGYPSCP
jgi:hypothetical protein